jgi:hypothetical protein
MDSFYYSELWRDHQIYYYNFNGYTLIKDLSKFTSNYKVIIIIFEKDGKKILTGFDDGILFPYIGDIIYNINSDSYKDYINNIVINLKNEINLYYTEKINIYMHPLIQYNLGFNLFEYFGISNKTYYDLFFIGNNINLITQKMKYSVRNIINKFEKKKIYQENEIVVYYGDISDNIYQQFVDKHFELAQKKTKSDKCWEILKKFIFLKKAFLVSYGNDFVYFFISKDFAYYGINACTKKSDICLILIYYAFKFCITHNCNNIYMYHYIENSEIDKNNKLAYFKKSMSNKIINNYYGIL